MLRYRFPTSGPAAPSGLRQSLSAALLLALSSCTATELLEHDPWAETGAGHHLVGTSTGWAWYKATVSAKGKDGALAPGGTPEVGEDDTDLEPNWGGALKYHYFLTDHLALGGIVELRSFDPDPVSPLSAELEPEDFQTIHLLASSRWFFDPIRGGKRWKPFLGLDLGFIPSVDLGQVTVKYQGGIPDETVEAEGSSYWTIAPVGGFSYWLAPGMTLDIGAFYEWPLTASEDTVRFENLGGAKADVKVEPEGWIGFVGLSWHL